MRLLADENVPLPVVRGLREDGHDVVWIGAHSNASPSGQIAPPTVVGTNFPVWRVLWTLFQLSRVLQL
jgi:hypothetical protein